MYFVTGDGVVVVPSETAAVYNEIKSDSEYAQKRSRINVFDEYLMSMCKPVSCN